MSVACVRRVFLVLIFLPGVAFGDVEVTGVTYGLPPFFGPITDVPVEVKAYRPRQNPDRPGELLRNRFGTLVADGAAIKTSVTDGNGQYKLPIPLETGASAIVILTFNRKGQVVTQELPGVVVKDGTPLRLDVVVPKPVAREATCQPQVCPPRHCHLIRCR